MSQFNSLTKKENQDKTAKNKKYSWINCIINCIKKSFILRHFLCFLYSFCLLFISIFLARMT